MSTLLNACAAKNNLEFSPTICEMVRKAANVRFGAVQKLDSQKYVNLVELKQCGKISL